MNAQLSSFYSEQDEFMLFVMKGAFSLDKYP